MKTSSKKVSNLDYYLACFIFERSNVVPHSRKTSVQGLNGAQDLNFDYVNFRAVNK